MGLKRIIFDGFKNPHPMTPIPISSYFGEKMDFDEDSSSETDFDEGSSSEMEFEEDA